MDKRASSVVAAMPRALGAATLALLASCGQKGPLIGVKQEPPPVVSNVAPDAGLAVPDSVPASAPPRR